MNNRNLEYDEGYYPPHAEMVAEALRSLDMSTKAGSIRRFIETLRETAPNGERVMVQFFPNGDWFVGKPEEAMKQAARERWVKGMKPNRNGNFNKYSLNLMGEILQGKHDDTPAFRQSLAEEFLAQQERRDD